MCTCKFCHCSPPTHVHDAAMLKGGQLMVQRCGVPVCLLQLHQPSGSQKFFYSFLLSLAQPDSPPGWATDNLIHHWAQATALGRGQSSIDGDSHSSHLSSLLTAQVAHQRCNLWEGEGEGEGG